ncbi:hypothetical protein L917_00621 [Phytophthora nicotianae]|uniref:Uncharacterized protein n=1 Tax=Phytophthora nicotianae TaxID=4792 RepID=W2M2R6_PHYNI|nr:hypothetical protein L917_00621 [Phytophthora nicotianae]
MSEFKQVLASMALLSVWCGSFFGESTASSAIRYQMQVEEMMRAKGNSVVDMFVMVQEVAMTVSLTSEVMPEAAVVLLAVAVALYNAKSSLAMVELILVDLWLVTAADVVVVTVVAVDEMLVVVVVEAVVVALHREVETNVKVNRTILEIHVTNLELLESTLLPLD